MPAHTVILTADEWATVERLGHRRQDPKVDRPHARSNKVDTHTSEVGVHLLGIMGEVCFARWSGLTIDTEEHRGGDGGVDFTMRCGLTVDVKTCRRPGDELPLISTQVGKALTAQVAVLVTKCEGGGVIRGWANACDFIRLGKYANYLGRADSDRLVIEQQFLHDLKYLQWFDEQRVVWDWASKSWVPTFNGGN